MTINNYIILYSQKDGTKFIEAGTDELDCSSTNGTTISNSSECKLAAKKLGVYYERSISSRKYPKGCFVHTDVNSVKTVFWNEHRFGANIWNKQKKSSPICILTGR